MEGLSASAAFREHLRRLCLDQFPCGRGSWNKSRFPPKKAQAPRGGVPRQASASFRNGLSSPDEETVEALTEYLRSLGSPWALPPDCSPADQQLRELAVLSPQSMKDHFIFSYFTSLRLVNKNVTEIDAGLLKFPNLEELILTANHISKIDSTHLPPTLKVLELCGNEIGSLKDLCAHPPPALQHLGLGHNGQLGSSEEQYLTDAFWPNLVSLDLSYNNFTNLLSLFPKLLTLKRLRILVLQGNPLSLLPGYRGFTIDSLPKLCALDDTIITPDDRHNFLGLAGEPDLIRRYTKMIVTIGKIRGLPNPVVSDEPESGPESPVITYSYYVTYEFAKGEKIEEKGTVKVVVSQAQQSRSNILDAESPPEDVEDGGGSAPTPVERTPTPVKSELPLETANIHATPRKSWAETIECDYKKEHLTRDLVGLKAFLLAGTTVSVVEEKVVSWPIVVSPDESPGKKGKGKGEKGKAEKSKAGKGEKDKGKKEKGKDEKGKKKEAGKGGNKKKKKSPSPELRSDPPILKILGSAHVNLESLLAGEPLLETVCDFGVLITESSVKPPSPKEKENKKGTKKDKKTKAGTESSASQKTLSPTTPKGKGRKKESLEAERKPPLSPPLPLTVEFQMRHIKWKSASEILIKCKPSE
uniref:Leucine-rich repeat-containing protein 43 isoform X1 n=1 Tax=Pogona vitticeps TaxID=103695 RepID=A0ABM5F2N9_9SAUR